MVEYPEEKIEKEVPILESKYKEAKKKYPPQYSIKLPREIVDYFKIKKGSLFKFRIDVRVKDYRFLVANERKNGKKRKS